LDGMSIVQDEAPATFALPAGLVLLPGDTVILARDTTRASFEAFWGRALGPTTLFFDTNDRLPRLNGDETFMIDDGTATAVDGPTAAFAEGRCYTRKLPLAAAASLSAWTVTVGTAGASPGSGPAGEAGGLFISEICDAAGTGNFVYEFIELYYAGAN
jgi:hypothetical protein